MHELLKAIEELKRAYKASGVGSVLIDLDADNERIEIYDNERNEIKQDKPITNGEWLRGLSDEELANKLVYGYMRDDIFCDIDLSIDCAGGTNCVKCARAWLRAEHKE